MTLLSLVANVALGAALLGMWRRSHDRFWLVVAVSILVGTGIGLIRFGLATDRLVGGPNGAVVDVGALLFAAVLAAEAVGLPRRVAIATGIGLRSRDWEFDRRLFQERGRLLEVGVRLRDDPSGREAVLDSAMSHLRLISKLRAPNQEWAGLRDGLVAADRDWIALILGALPPERTPDVQAAHERANVAWARLREQYRSDSRAIAARRDPHRGETLLYAAGGLLLAALGVSTARLLGGVHASDREPAFWFGMVLLAAGSAILLGAAIRLWRGARSRLRSTEGVDAPPSGS